MSAGLPVVSSLFPLRDRKAVNVVDLKHADSAVPYEGSGEGGGYLLECSPTRRVKEERTPELLYVFMFTHIFWNLWGDTESTARGVGKCSMVDPIADNGCPKIHAYSIPAGAATSDLAKTRLDKTWNSLAASLCDAALSISHRKQ